MAAAELRIMKALDKLRAEVRSALAAVQPAVGAVKRSVAARLMGVSSSKLDTLIKLGKVRTADDRTLVPIAEVKRYTAPKAKRQRRPSVGHRARMKHVDGQSDEALADATKAIRERKAGP